MSNQSIDRERLEALIGKVSTHASGAMGILLAYMGDELGLYRALVEDGPLTSEGLATATGTDERYVREWLASNAAGGYIECDTAAATFSLTPEQALVFTGEGKPGCMSGFFQSLVSAYLDHPKNLEVFKTGEGIAWGDKHACCFCGTERFFRPMYEASLIDEWIPALEGVVDKLSAGGKIADVGCGRGSSSVLMARAFPNSKVYGFDYHAPSIESAIERAAEAGLSTGIEFTVSDAKSFEARGYDLVTVFDALHDMGDPVGVARHIRSTLNEGGTLMLVEPRAGDSLEENLIPQAQTMYGFSTLTCTAVSKSQEVGLALGAMAGPKRLTEVLNEAGFANVRLAFTSAGNIVLEATG